MYSEKDYQKVANHAGDDANYIWSDYQIIIILLSIVLLLVLI